MSSPNVLPVMRNLACVTAGIVNLSQLNWGYIIPAVTQARETVTFLLYNEKKSLNPEKYIKDCKKWFSGLPISTVSGGACPRTPYSFLVSSAMDRNTPDRSPAPAPGLKTVF